MSEPDRTRTGGPEGAPTPEGAEGDASREAPAGAAPSPGTEIVPVGDGPPFRVERSTAIRVATMGRPAWMATTRQFESFRELRTRLVTRGERRGREHFTTMVVPMTAACGGSFVARNLAAAFTLQQRPSLLIECNFERPPDEEDGFLPEREAQGLFDFLSDADDPSAVLPIWPTAIPGLNVIPAGRRNPALALAQREQLSSAPMRELMARVRNWPCHAFLDAPPFEGSPDARILSDHADVIVLVVGYGRATPREVAQAAAMFDPEKLAGAVFNEAPAKGPKRAR